MAIEFGVVDHMDRQNVPVHETYDARLKLMELFDQAGFSTFHITEHHFTPLGLAPSPLIFLSAAARITKSIRLAPLVLILPLYNPLRLAGELCMLDHLSKGRLDIGVGRGISPYELAFYNVNHLESQSIYNEAYEVLMMALTRDTVDFRGQYFKYFNVPMEMRPYQKPHPPLWYATGSEEGAAWAGSQNHNVAFLAPTPRAKVLVEAYKHGRASNEENASRPIAKIGIARHLYLAETDEVAQDGRSRSLQGLVREVRLALGEVRSAAAAQDRGCAFARCRPHHYRLAAHGARRDRAPARGDGRQLLHHAFCLRQSDLRAECPVSGAIRLRGDAAFPEQIDHKICAGSRLI